jgi:hypothetical protein
VLGGNGSLPVYLFGSSKLHVTQINTATLLLAGATPNSSSIMDVNGDGIPDLELGFKMSSLKLASNAGGATLTGRLNSGRAFNASGAVTIMASPPKHCN